VSTNSDEPAPSLSHFDPLIESFGLVDLALTGSYAVARSAWATKNWRARRETPAQIAQTLENLREFRSRAINTTRVSHSAILRAEPPQRALVRLFEIGGGVLFGRHEAIGDPRERRW
jgi:hypothetical protein